MQGLDARSKKERERKKEEERDRMNKKIREEGESNNNILFDLLNIVRFF